MKRIIATILILLCGSPVLASGWYWVSDGSGYWLRSNGYKNDGFKYRRSCSYGCRGCKKCQYIPIKVVAPVIHYTKDWTVTAMNATHSILDKQYFLQAQAALLALAPQSYQQSSQYSYSTVQRGVAYQPLGYQQLDANALGHSLERATLRMTDTAGQSVAALGAATQQAVEANKQIMLYNAFSAAVQPQPTYETHHYSQQSGTGTASGTYGVGTLHTIRSLAGAALVQNHCASCHSGSNAKSGLDLTSIDQYGEEDRLAIADSAQQLMSEAKMPKNHPPLPGDAQAAIADWIRGRPAEVVQRQYRPKVQVQQGPPPPPNNDPPPEPMP